nr:MAG TPA: hypothetical protein [Herelleviridae sp.]DAJ08770.1 MAG TPA: hypothetical protein [Caudoviricetes sp.]DAR53620.1 MAG TPA: hypothetical protein [Caudoviricetes sp.]
MSFRNRSTLRIRTRPTNRAYHSCSGHYDSKFIIVCLRSPSIVKSNGRCLLCG